MSATKAEIRIGDMFGPGNSTWGSCEVDWDCDRQTWRADLWPIVDQPPLRSWAQSRNAAVLAVFAKWMACEDELRAAIPFVSDDESESP